MQQHHPAGPVAPLRGGRGARAGASGDPRRGELLACTAAGGLWVVGFPAFLRRLEAVPRERWRPGARKAS